MARANQVHNWSIGATMWRDLIIKSGGTIDAGPDARDRMALLVCHLIAADRLPEDVKAKTWRRFTEARKSPKEDSPTPVKGRAYIAAEAVAFLHDEEQRKAA